MASGVWKRKVTIWVVGIIKCICEMEDGGRGKGKVQHSKKK